MPLFDQYMIIDWSAANSPKRGKDSIWIAQVHNNATIQPLENLPTRADAMALVKATCLEALQKNHRLFIGVDFAFGYPAGTAATLTSKSNWRALWQEIARHITDTDKNKSNRFEVAGLFNQRFASKEGPFWGHPHQHSYTHLPPTKPAAMPPGIPERRLVEQQVRSAKTVWQLAYTGAVGSQSLLGIAHLHALITEPALQSRIAVWPFDTDFADKLTAPVTLAEIYPSAFPVTPKKSEVLDAAQVRTLASGFARLDQRDQFAPLLTAPAVLSAQERQLVLAEEGWIVGATYDGELT